MMEQWVSRERQRNSMLGSHPQKSFLTKEALIPPLPCEALAIWTKSGFCSRIISWAFLAMAGTRVSIA